MESILDRIYKARIEALKRTDQPTTVYVGEVEAVQIWDEARCNCAVTHGSPPGEDRTKLFGLSVYIVDAESHLRVV